MQTADFYSSATGTLRVNGGQDANAPKGVSLSVDDLAYIKQGSRANDAEPVTDYDLLDNKPQINNVTLTGNKSLNDLGIQPKIDSTHKVSSDNIDDSTATNKFATAAQLEQISTNETNILSISNTGTKNIIAPKLMDTPATGITMAVNADSTITVSSDGENTQSIVRLGTQDTFTLERGTQYVLTGCPSGGSQTTYGLMIALGAATGLDYGSGKTFTYNGEVSYSISIIVRAEQNIDNITFAPMIVKKTDYDAGYTNYEPCCMSLAEITRILKNQ